MKERPILFSGPMVRAILEGRKTQTRRVIKPHIFGVPMTAIPGYSVGSNPYGQPGDRLWVRETWGIEKYKTKRIVFKAGDRAGNVYPVEKWRPSIHMPRWASRSLLEITEVRVERIQSISAEDAKAEGLSAITKDKSLFKYGIPDIDGYPGTDDYGWPWTAWEKNPIAAFRKLWDSINAKKGYPWDANPWVWVVKFRRVGE